MTIIFHYTVSDLAIKTELVTLRGRCGPRERQAVMNWFTFAPEARDQMVALGIDGSPRANGKPKHVRADLVTFRAVILPNGTRIEKRLIVVDTSHLAPQQVERAISEMAESKRKAQDIAARNARIIAARARNLRRFALAGGA